MPHVLENPVYNALRSGDATLAFGTQTVAFFDEQVSPFAGFEEGYASGFEELYNLLPAKRQILYASPKLIDEPAGWQLLAAVKGLQFVFKGMLPGEPFITPVPLSKEHVDAMVQLATLTKPGPFNTRTIEFGHYYGIFEKDTLVAMTGQRLHVAHYTEISAVCTHPDYLGKGFAAALLQHQLRLICHFGQVPFLHVREDNERAIALYKRLGFAVRGGMNFYFMQKRKF